MCLSWLTVALIVHVFPTVFSDRSGGEHEMGRGWVRLGGWELFKPWKVANAVIRRPPPASELRVVH